MPPTCCGLVPQVTCGARALQSIVTSLAKAAPGSLGRVRQKRDGVVPHLALGRELAAGEILDRRLVGRHEAVFGGELDRHVADREPPFDRHLADCLAGELDGAADAAIRPDLADEGEDHVLGMDARRQRALEIDPHRLRLDLRQGLRREDMLALGRADAPGERADAADRAGVAVAAHQSEAGQRDAELGRDDMDDALPLVVHVEEIEAVFLRAAPRRADHVDAAVERRVAVAAAGLGVDHMVDDGEDLLGMGRRAPGRLELPHCDTSAHLVQEQPVDAEQRRVLAEIGDDVIGPDFLEECPRRRHNRFLR